MTQKLRKVVPVAVAASLVAVGLSTAPASAYSSVSTGQSDQWNVNDAAIPGLDTGSVRSTTANALLGYGGIRLRVAGGSGLLNGALLRGFGLTYDGAETFSSKHAVVINGVAVQRELTIDRADSYGRFFDTFTNTTRKPISVSVAFGGQLGYNTGTNQSAIATTSSGDTRINRVDGWASWYTPSAGAGSASTNGPSATTIGTPGYAGSLERTGNFLRDPFANPLPTSGDEANHPALLNRMVLQPGQSRSVAHFVVTGLSETRNVPGGTSAPAAGSQVAAVQATAAALTAKPDFGGLSAAEICSLENYDPSALAKAAGVRGNVCAASRAKRLPGAVTAPVTQPTVKTTSSYDVVGKTIVQLKADMAAGRTTTQQVVRAYLDRIAAYDQGPLGLHSVLAVAPDAMAQAKAADRARKTGDKRPLLGIPIMVKDIIDTKDMPTTGGSLVFDGYRPTKDAWQVAKLREAGAIILGKANLSEFANSGYFSESAYGQVWNAFDPSRSPIGSSGGSAVAVASSFAAASLGSQTGDSLWGPSGAASLVSLRGTDGMQSSDGAMPLTVVQDYVGVISQSPADQALLLNAVAVGNPEDALDDVADGQRPRDWTRYLDGKALKGVVIGVPADAFTDPFGTTETSAALRAKFAAFRKAGATIKEITAAPAAPARTYTGDTGYEGWRQWVAAHPDNPYPTAEQIITSPLRLPYNVRSSYTGTGAMTPENLAAMQTWRASYRQVLADWMDEQGVDTVLYPTELSDIHLNDSSGNSFGRRDPQSSASGVPTVIFPAGVNAHGQPVGFQLQGKQFQDPELLGYAYAFEKIAKGRVLPAITPALRAHR
ncbi:amidase [Actinoplanes lutulentus]|uniref:Amidase n=1 Tax=Actinoplanes lutulentus TaxID=1287878 RepID=A0A327Z1V6_9ACTN|nr:amidase [Actinoplanes lutulentus]MBB2946333.1 amidase [Actinoplanes lutulentus]RAK28728.1 amidase [Actinoplanes lutulentus]